MCVAHTLALHNVGSLGDSTCWFSHWSSQVRMLGFPCCLGLMVYGNPILAYDLGKHPGWQACHRSRLFLPLLLTAPYLMKYSADAPEVPQAFEAGAVGSTVHGLVCCVVICWRVSTQTWAAHGAKPSGSFAVAGQGSSC